MVVEGPKGSPGGLLFFPDFFRIFTFLTPRGGKSTDPLQGNFRSVTLILGGKILFALLFLFETFGPYEDFSMVETKQLANWPFPVLDLFLLSVWMIFFLQIDRFLVTPHLRTNNQDTILVKFNIRLLFLNKVNSCLIRLNWRPNICVIVLLFVRVVHCSSKALPATEELSTRALLAQYWQDVV